MCLRAVSHKINKQFDKVGNVCIFAVSIDIKSMGKSFFSRVTACAVACIFFVAAPSCVNNKYELSEENLDMNVTVFQEGISLPLGSTADITLKELLAKMELGEDFDKYFGAGEDGAYMVSIDGEYDLSEELESLTDILDIDAVGIDHEAKFSLKDVNLDGLEIDAIDFPYKKKLSELITLPEVNLPSMPAQEVNVSAGLADYAIDKSALNKVMKDNLGEYKESGTLISLSEAKIDAASLVISDPDAEISLDNPIIPGFGAIDLDLKKEEEYSMEDSPINLVFEAELPSGITGISALTFKNASLDITVRLSDHFLKSGHVDPTVDLDLSHVFHLADVANNGHDKDTWDHVVDLFDLTHESTEPWSETHNIGIKSLVIESGDVVPENGKVYLRKSVHVVPKVTIDYNELVTTLNLMQDHHQAIVEIDVKFNNFEVDDIVFSTNPMTMDFNKTISVGSDSGIEVPEQIKKISSIKFTEASKLGLEIVAQNLIDNMDLSLESLQFTFPESLDVKEGTGYTVNNNVVTVAGTAISETPYRLDVMLGGIALGEPEDGKIYIKEDVKVVANVKAEAQDISLSDLPSSDADDLKVNVKVTPLLEFDDAVLTVKQTGFPIDLPVQSINAELPATVKDMEIVTVYLEGDPKISIDVNLPDLSTILGEQVSMDIVPSKEGVALYFPEMLKFPTSGEHFTYYNHSKHALEYKTEFANIDFPIEKLEIKPVIEGDKAYARGEIKVSGGVSVTGGEITYKQVKKIVESENAVFSFTASMPDLTPAELELGSYETSAGRVEQELDFLSDVEVPEMLEQLQQIELDDVKLFIDIDAAGLPSLGDDAEIIFDVTASLPDFVMLDENDPRVNNNTLLLNVVGTERDGEIVFAMDPVKIIGLDLSDVDLKSDEPLDQKVVLDASLKLKDASLVATEWVNRTHSIKLDAVIKSDKQYAEGEQEKILVKSIKGRVNYAIDPIEEEIDLSDIAEALNGDNLTADLDIHRFYVALDVTTNLGVSAKADLKITPRYDGEWDEEKSVVPGKAIELSAAENAADMKTTSLWISNTDEGMPAGYEFVELDLLSLLRNMPEAIKLNLTAGTDAEEVCVFEPGEEYKLSAKYAAGIPLELGHDFAIEYRDTIQGIPAELGQIMEYGTLGLGGSVTSSIPLNFDMSVLLLDSEDNLIEMAETSGKQVISGCGPNGTPVTTPLDIVLEKKDGVDMSDVSSIVLLFKANTESVAGMPFKEESSLKAVINARIPEGITMDLSGLLFPKEDEGSEEDENETNE